MDNYDFNDFLWLDAIGENFHYAIEENPIYLWMELHGHTEPSNELLLLNRGLLNSYSDSGVENDFNSYAEVVFTNPKKMKRLIAEYPIVKRKYKVFKDFYMNIDQGFAPVFNKIDG